MGNHASFWGQKWNHASFWGHKWFKGNYFIIWVLQKKKKKKYIGKQDNNITCASKLQF